MPSTAPKPIAPEPIVPEKPARSASAKTDRSFRLSLAARIVLIGCSAAVMATAAQLAVLPTL
jgi:hypothetical protein